MASLPEHMRGHAAGRQKLPREVMSVHQRERVLAAAIPVFAKRGYQGTTMDDLLAAGRIGVGNFYDLFEGKEDCFLGGLEQIIVATRRRMVAESSSGDGWAEKTYLGLRALLSAMLERPLEARLVLLEAQSAGATAMARYNALLDEARTWLSEGRALGTGDPAPGYEEAVVSGLAFYLQQCALDPRSHQIDSLLEETATLVLEPVTGSKELNRVRRSGSAVR